MTKRFCFSFYFFLSKCKYAWIFSYICRCWPKKRHRLGVRSSLQLKEKCRSHRCSCSLLVQAKNSNLSSQSFSHSAASCYNRPNSNPQAQTTWERTSYYIWKSLRVVETGQLLTFSKFQTKLTYIPDVNNWKHQT